MSYRNMRMADGHLSLDRLLDGIDADEEERELQLDNQRFVLLMVSEALLVLAGLERLVPILEQIVENGANRQESIAHLCRVWRRKWSGTRRNYYRGVQDLLVFFSANKIKGETSF